MMRSLYSAVSGLQNNQTRMDVIGNNVANVNTTGFKKGRVTFEDILSQTLTGAAQPTDVVGGTNPKQIGLGMTIASIDTLMNQGSIQTTGKNTDLAIQGEGFFITKKGEQTFFTRNGNFMLDKDGSLVNPNGLKVQGWNAVDLPNGDRIVNTSSPVDNMVIPLEEKLAARETTNVDMKSNLNFDTPVLAPGATVDDIAKNTHSTSIDVFDRYGTKHVLNINFTKEALNQWRATMTLDGIDTNTIKASIGAPKIDTNNQLVLNFDTKGVLLSETEAAGANIQTKANGQLAAAISYTLPDGETRNFNLNLGTSGSIKDSITQFSSPSTTRAYKQDGYDMAYLESFKIDDSGTITGTYTNGETRTLGQIALATFVNPMGLTKEGDSNYSQSNNSGLANVGSAQTQDRGKITAGALEMSNVDLAETFTDMIVTERGFQANSRVVTTSDTMLQEILQLKRE